MGAMGAAAGAVPAAPSVTARRSLRLRRLAIALAVAAIAQALAVVRIGTAGDHRFELGLDLVTLAFIGTVVLFPIVGALIADRRPTTRIAWLMIAIGVVLGFGLLTFGYGTIGMPPRAELPGALPALLASQLFLTPALGTGATLLFLLFPDDRLLSPRWRSVGVLSVAGSIVYVAGSMTLPGPLDAVDFPGVANPLGLPIEWRGVSELLIVAGNAALVGGAALGALSLVVRYRRADWIERAQIRWIALVGSLAAAAFGVAAFRQDAISDAAWTLGLSFLACMPIAIGVAITRYRLFDIDRLINRALVYGSLTAILAGVFTAAVGLAQRLFVGLTRESSDAAIVLTTLIVATLYAPLRRRLEALVDRHFKYEERRFGAYRDEISRVLDVIEPGRAARRLVAEAVRELEATGGAVVDASDHPTATAGAWPVTSAVRLSIPGGGGVLHSLVVGPRADGRPHDPRAIAQLKEMAGLAAAATRPPDASTVGSDRRTARARR